MSDGLVNTDAEKESSPHVATTDADVLMVGGSLTNCLAALWMAQEKPDVLIGIIEGDSSLLSGRQWAFFDNAIPSEHYRRLLPFISQRWNGYHARSMGRETSGTSPISLLSGRRIATAIEASPRIETLVSASVTAVERDAIELTGDELVSAPLVLDARPVREHRSIRSGSYHACEFELKCTKPHDLERPVLMDTALDQTNGFQFLQYVPLSATDLIVTHVVLTLDEKPDQEAAKASVLRHALSSNWIVADATLLRAWSETIVTQLDAKTFSNYAQRKAVPTGQAALMAHPNTLSPVPQATRMAEIFANLDEPSTAAAKEIVASVMAEQHSRFAFHFDLNRQIVDRSTPEFGAELFEYIHSLPESLIERFYRADCRSPDRMRIAMVRPGNSLVSVGKAIKQLGGAKRAP